MAHKAAVGPALRSSGRASSRRRAVASSLATPCRTVMRKRSERKIDTFAELDVFLVVDVLGGSDHGEQDAAVVVLLDFGA